MFSHLQKYDLEEETSSGEDMLPGLEMNPKRPVPGIDGSSFVGSTIRPKGKGDVPSKAPDDGVLALMREHGLITVKSVKDDGSKEPKYSWPAMGPSAVRDSLSFQLNRFWNPRDKSTFPSSYTEQLDVVETLTDGFPFAPHDDHQLVRSWLSKCAKSLEAEKSAAASRILGVDKKGAFSMSKDRTCICPQDIFDKNRLGASDKWKLRGS